MDTSASRNTSKVSTPVKENDGMDSEAVSSQLSVDQPKEEPSPDRPLKIYTRSQLLALHKSPLISVPNGMPELREWFGSENEQNLHRKDSEPSTPNSGRERRFRRDTEDGDLPPRPSFRSAASQPSQMGNFRHQSLRSSDRDLDRDREGERLRNLSDKFDRDRLSSSSLRNKERDVAPHFSTGSSRGTAQQGTIAARRLEARDGNRKEDWRRGNDSRRSERPETTREERDSRRDSSRSRRDPSSSRQDTRRERDRDREEYRRERDRDRDDAEQDDPRKWREEGRRDPRRDRGRDKPHENSWENGDRRWALNDDRDRAKRGTARDKKSTVTDESKDKEDRRLEREKEKEPAWMDTYIPSASVGGILGGKGSDGELDGIQAWKKNMKEKEQLAQKALRPVEQDKESPGTDKPENPDEHMDEIQRFKRMMEMAQRKDPQTESVTVNTSTSVAEPSADLMSSGSRKPQEDVPILKTSTTDPSQSLLSLLTSTEISRTSSSQPTTDSTTSTTSMFKLNPRATDPSLAVERLSDNLPASNPSGTVSQPQGSRLLALGSRAPAKPQSNSQPSALNGTTLPVAVQPVHKAALPGVHVGPVQSVPKAPSRGSNGFSPFEEQREHAETLRQLSGERPIPSESGGWPESPSLEQPTAGHSAGKGSRFAKFFDAKTKENPVHPPQIPKPTTPVDFISSSPIPSQRQEPGFNNINPPNGVEHRTVEDLFAQLSMSSQLQRSNPPHSAQASNLGFGQQTHTNLQHLQQQQQLQSQHLHQHNNSRLDSFTESRNFTPDGLVPGLRSVPPPRPRDNLMFQDSIDEAVLLNTQQRLALQQQRGVDQLYPGSLSAGFGQQGNRNVGLPLQQQQFRGGPSPTLQGQHVPLQQRLPPGLANLGGRPPHDPTQLLGLQGGLGSQIHGGLHINPQQQGFNNFHPQNPSVGFVVPQSQLRGLPPGSAHTLPAHQLGGLGLPGGMDLRNANQQQSQLLAMSGLGGGAIRGVVNNGYNAASSVQLQNPLLAQVRQQPPPQLPPHMIPQMLPPHLQQPGPMTSSQSTQDLMALLMGGGQHRE